MPLPGTMSRPRDAPGPFFWQSVTREAPRSFHDLQKAKKGLEFNILPPDLHLFGISVHPKVE